MKTHDVNSLFGGQVDKIKDEHNFSVYVTTHNQKPGSVVRYELFDCVEVYITDLFTDRIDYSASPPEFAHDLISINYCEKGRFEGEFANGEFVYIGEGEVSVNVPEVSLVGNNFPLGHFSGVLIGIKTDEIRKRISCLGLGETHIDIEKIKNRLLQGNRFTVYRNDGVFANILSQMYSKNEAGREFYLKLKILELLQMLSLEDCGQKSEYKYYEKNRILKVKRIKEFLTSNLEKRVLLPELSKKFDISVTSLKECFKTVYGMPISEYMREYRMSVAASLLTRSTLNVAEISDKVGYENQSKFSEAFKKRMKLTPIEYRQLKSPVE